MRLLLCVGIPLLATLFALAGQPKPNQQPKPTVDRRATIRWILQLQAEQGGFLPGPSLLAQSKPLQPSLRATSAAVRALHYLGADVPNADRHRQFVLRCYDRTTGGFAEPGGQPDVALTSVGIMASVALRIQPQEYSAAWNYLHNHARTFEEIRIAAAAVEAASEKKPPFDVRPWIDHATKAADVAMQLDARDGGAREVGSAAALVLRLRGTPTQDQRRRWSRFLLDGQRPDGGWGKMSISHSDLETTYRVLRALMHLETPPRDLSALRWFLAAHRSSDGGYSVAAKEPPSMSGTYYATIILHWLDLWDPPSPM